MAEDSLKDLTINWMIGGFLIFCLITFAITFMYNNNPTGLNDGSNEILSRNYENRTNQLIYSTTSSDELLNITANTNPEVSDLGSRDSVAVSYKSKESASQNWEDSKELLSWVFSGDSGKILIGTIGGMIGFLSVFYIWRFIKNGL